MFIIDWLLQYSVHVSLRMLVITPRWRVSPVPLACQSLFIQQQLPCLEEVLDDCILASVGLVRRQAIIFK